MIERRSDQSQSVSQSESQSQSRFLKVLLLHANSHGIQTEQVLNIQNKDIGLHQIDLFPTRNINHKVCYSCNAIKSLNQVSSCMFQLCST